MPEKVESWVDYSAGYRQAVCDLIPDPNKRGSNSTGLIYAYFIGLVVGALVFKYTRES